MLLEPCSRRPKSNGAIQNQAQGRDLELNGLAADSEQRAHYSHGAIRQLFQESHLL